MNIDINSMNKRRDSAANQWVAATKEYRDALLTEYTRTNDVVSKDTVVVKLAGIIDDLTSIINAYEDLLQVATNRLSDNKES